MRAMYSITIIFGLLFVSDLTLGQSESPASSPSEAGGTESPMPAGGASAGTTEAMQNDGPAAVPEPTTEPSEDKSKDPATSASPPLIHESSTNVPTKGDDTTSATTGAKTGSTGTASNEGTTKTGGTGVNATATTPKDNSANGMHSSIVCLLLSALPIVYYRS